MSPRRDARPYLLGLLGDGVSASLTPDLHMREADHHGVRYLYRPIDVGRAALQGPGLGRLLDAARVLGFDALNVTYPFKNAVLPYLDELDPGARRLGAVNTVLVRDGLLVGHNTDSSGFRSAVQTHLPAARLDTVVQVGAGGAGAAVAEALLDLGVQELRLLDRDLDRARALRHELAARRPDVTVEAVADGDLASALSGAGGVVHCTPTGMAHHPGLPFDPDLLAPDLWVADIVYRPLETALLVAARSRGCRVLHGGYMAVYQAAHTFALVTGLTPDADRMLAHLDELVSAAERT